MKWICKNLFLGFIFIVSSACSDSPQQPDPDFTPINTKNSFSGLTSPIVFIDEAHHNFHTIEGRYKPFAQVLRSDGYTVKPGKKKFTLEYLKQADILVIVNALDTNRRDYNPPYGDAFEAEEVEALKEWVSQGGSLFFIADHAPFPKVSDNLSVAFGFEFNNGSVNDATFHIDNNSLSQHIITKGNPNLERIVKVKSLGGSAFKIPHNAKPLLTLGKGATSLISDIPLQVTAGAHRISMDGWYQGAVLEVGKGRIAVFSEAMMFTSQVYIPSGKKMGLVSYGAEQNEQFLLNVMHWLSGLI
jgi:hypothetical protein